MTPVSNPFFYGNPVPPDQFVGRKRELKRITSRIVNQGQSTAVVGEPRSGKTSLLDYLAAPETRDELYAFLWWLADELVRTVRDEPSFEEWLRKQGWEGLLTRSEKQQLDKGVRAIASLLKGGVTTLIEAAAKGAGEDMVKGG